MSRPTKSKQPRADADCFTEFVIDQLRGLGVVEARAMFGGKGLYWRDRIFGLIDESRLYFRVSPETAGAYEERGSQPFEPWPRHVMKGYYEVPASVLEDTEEAVAWARAAWSLPRARPRKSTAGQSSKEPSRQRSARKRTVQR